MFNMAKKNDIVSKEADEMKSVSEALKKEKVREPKGKTHYKIFRIEKDPKTCEETKITMTKFWAKNDQEAYEELKKYKRIANKAYTYYFGTTGNYIGNKLGKDGKLKRYDDHDEMMKAWKAEEPMTTKIKDAILCPFERIWDKAKDFRWWLSDMCFFFKNNHQRNESWSLDYHMINDIIFNLPILIKNKHGVPTEFCAKARAELHKEDKKFNLEKSFEENPNSDEKEMKLADKMWSEELERGLLYAKLYSFYTSFGKLDKDAWEDSEKFEEEWAKTIPYVPGTYHEIDYRKLYALENKYWNSLWNWIKDNGRNLWD